MQCRSLGKTGMGVSEIGFGAWGIGGNVNGSIAYGAIDTADALRALRCAYGRGICFYDTSDFYGFGRSESLIGEAFADVRDEIVIASKGGLIDRDGRQNFSPDYIRAALEASLRRLRTDYLDLYQLHSPPLDILEDGSVLETLCALKDEGKIRAIGISARSPQEGLAAVERYAFDCIQVNFNLIDQRAEENGLFALCEERGIGVIARTPLCFGFLTGQYDGAIFAPDDHRRRWKPEQVARWASAYHLFVDALRERIHNQTNAQFALRFCLSYPAVSTVIPGMLTPEQVNENVVASALGTFSDEERERLEAIYREHTFFIS